MADTRSPGTAFPGATGVTVLDVYDWVAPDGLRGGSAHVHLASTEGYVVLSGAGRLQTLGAQGYAETPLRPGDCLWFTPGTIHRLVNDGDLRLLVVMQNAGLPEHGDAVLTFPPGILADPAAYARAASLAGDRAAGGALAEAARRRASLAIEGYGVLREQVAENGPAGTRRLLRGRVATGGRARRRLAGALARGGARDGRADRCPPGRDRGRRGGSPGRRQLVADRADSRRARLRHVRAARDLPDVAGGTRRLRSRRARSPEKFR